MGFFTGGKNNEKRVTGEDVRGLAREVRKTVELVVNEEKDVDKKEQGLQNWLQNLEGPPSPKELEKALKQGQNIEYEIEEIVQRMESAIEQKSQMMQLIQQSEQILGKEEYSVQQELQDINRNIRKMENSGLAKQDADYVVKELFDVSQKIGKASKDMEKLALMFYDLERAEGSELQAENHVEEETGKLKKELNALKKLSRRTGTEQEINYEQKLESLEQKIEQQIQTEIGQENQQINTEAKTLQQFEQEINQLLSEIETFKSEINRVDSDLPQSQTYQEDEKAVQQALNKVQEAQERMRSVSEKLQKEENQFQKIQNMANQAQSTAAKLFKS